VLTLALVSPSGAAAQQRRPAPASAQRQPLAVRGFGDIGVTWFTAADTFDAVFGSSSGTFFGGGVEVVLPSRVFAGVRFSRFEKTGERVSVSDGEVFPLGIDLTATITPIEISGGYRFRGAGRTGTVIPYLGGGVGWHKYKETSEFAVSGEDVDETFTGYHVLGGVEVRLGRWFGVAGEGQWTTVPDALGADSSSAASEFGESDLGGFAVRVKFVIGR
jgi:opacity protein-like surface antigen